MECKFYFSDIALLYIDSCLGGVFPSEYDLPEGASRGGVAVRLSLHLQHLPLAPLQRHQLLLDQGFHLLASPTSSSHATLKPLHCKFLHYPLPTDCGMDWEGPSNFWAKKSGFGQIFAVCALLARLAPTAPVGAAGK